MDVVSLPASGDILALIILAFLFYLISRNDFMQPQKTRYYLFVVFITLLIVLLEILTNLFDYYATPFLRLPAQIANACGFSLMYALPVILAFLYSERIFQIKGVIVLPTVLGILLGFISIWTGWIFSVDIGGHYARGSMFWANAVVFLYGYAVLFFAHWQMAGEYDRDEKSFLWFLYIIVLGTSLLQLINSHLTVMWGGMAVTELLYYVFLRELQFKFDAITGVRNRSCFQQKLMDLRPDESLFLVSFDVNNLKKINDHYGHAAGDQFLKQSAEILKSAYRDCGTLYRVGGDEFMIIATDCSEEKLKAAREKMLVLLSEAQAEYEESYYIANAYSRFAASLHRDVNACLQEVDKKMYEDKIRSKKA